MTVTKHFERVHLEMLLNLNKKPTLSSSLLKAVAKQSERYKAECQQGEGAFLGISVKSHQFRC